LKKLVDDYIPHLDHLCDEFGRQPTVLLAHLVARDDVRPPAREIGVHFAQMHGDYR
jgi:hypothetical protein